MGTRVGSIKGKLLFAVLACHLSLVTCHSAQAQELKIGYVNLGKVFDGYEKTKAFDADLGKQGKQKDAELQARLGELKKLREGLELLNDQARDAKTREIEQKSDDLQRFRSSTARDLSRQRDKIAKEIFTEIQQAVQDYAKANGFAVVFDERGLLYGQPALDVTDAILQQMNNRATAKR